MQKWHVKLTKSDHKKIKMVLRSKRTTLEAKKHAQILLDIDESDGRKPLSLSEVTVSRGVCQNTVIRVRRSYAEFGIESAIFRQKRETPPVEPKITGEVEAHIIATACSKAPEGKARWTLSMIANKIVLDGVIESISDEAVRLVLKNTTQASSEIAMVGHGKKVLRRGKKYGIIKQKRRREKCV